MANGKWPMRGHHFILCCCCCCCCCSFTMKNCLAAIFQFVHKQCPHPHVHMFVCVYIRVSHVCMCIHTSVHKLSYLLNLWTIHRTRDFKTKTIQWQQDAMWKLNERGYWHLVTVGDMLWKCIMKVLFLMDTFIPAVELGRTVFKFKYWNFLGFITNYGS